MQRRFFTTHKPPHQTRWPTVTSPGRLCKARLAGRRSVQVGQRRQGVPPLHVEVLGVEVGEAREHVALAAGEVVCCVHTAAFVQYDPALSSQLSAGRLVEGPNALTLAKPKMHLTRS